MCLKCLLVYCFLATVVSSSPFLEDFTAKPDSPDSPLAQAVGKVADSWITHDAMLLCHRSSSSDQVTRVAKAISSVLIPRRPTQYFETTNLSAFTLNSRMVASSRTFCVLVYDAIFAKNFTLLEKHLARICHTKHSPKLLLIFVQSEDERIDVQDQLKSLWAKGFAYTIVLEASFYAHARSPGAILVHRLKSRSTYSRTEYDGDVTDWYAEKFRDIGGSEFVLCLFNTSNLHEELLSLQLMVLRENLNVSFKVIMGKNKKNRCDMTYNLFYLFHNAYYTNSREHTPPIYVDRFCLFTPAISQASEEVSWGAVFAFVVGVFVVAMISGFSKLLDVRQFVKPFNTVAVMLGVSLNSIRLSSRTEKILYLCLVQVATRYMSMLYTELFSETATGQREIDIKDFEDLRGLNLSIRVSVSLYNFFSDPNNSIVSDDLMHVFQRTAAIPEDETRDRRNTGYFTMEVLEMFRQRKMQRRRVRKKTNLCLGSVSVVHYLRPRWAYKDRVGDLIWRINEYGFRKHEYGLHFRGTGYPVATEQIRNIPSAQRRMIVALLYGYVLVALVFLAELSAGYVRTLRTTRRKRETKKKNRLRIVVRD